MTERRIIPARRAHTVLTLTFPAETGSKYHIGFGQECDEKGKVIDPTVLEVFADARRTGSDQEAMLHDACIAVSLLIQHGCSCAMQAEAYGELRNEGEQSGPPASVIGAIARMGVEIEKSTAQ